MTASTKTLKITIAILSGLIIIISVCLALTTRKQPIWLTGHYATIMSREFYDEAYKSAPMTIVSDKDTAGGIVNHHLLAAPLLAQFFDGLKDQKPKHIIIIGPDHMSRGTRPITISAEGWKTGYGDVAPDTALIDRLASNMIANIEESPFDHEFSVGGLVTFAKRSLPKAKVTTIILRSDAKISDLEKLAAILPRSADTLVIASIDFSHYLPSDVADFHDLTSRAVISNFDIANLDKIEIDSAPTLRTALEYFKLRGAQNDTVVASTNSAKITGKLDTQETTSYLNQYFSGFTIARQSNSETHEPLTSLYLGNIKPLTPPSPHSAIASWGEGERIVSPEDRFMSGFMSIDDGSKLLSEFKKPDLAVGIARYTDKTIYYLFPTVVDDKTRRLMTAAEKADYFRQNDIKESIVTIQN